MSMDQTPMMKLSSYLPADRTWLDARAEEIVRCNPDGLFPEKDREFLDATQWLIRKVVGSQMRGRSYALFNEDDLASEVKIRVVGGFSSFDGKNFGGWVYSIARNTFHSLLKKNKHTSVTSIEEISTRRHNDAYSADEIVVDQVHVTEEVNSILLTDFMAWLIQRNAKHATIVQMYLDGLPDKEIARRVGVAYRTVCSVLRRAPSAYQKFLALKQQRLQQARLEQ